MCVYFLRYTCQPDEMLGVYVFNKNVDGRRSSLISNEERTEEAIADDFSVSTVSHFNLIHFSCHKRVNYENIHSHNLLLFKKLFLFGHYM